MNNLKNDTSYNSTKVQVADNVCYTILYSSAANRIYLTLKGFWKNTECVPLYLQDLQKTLALTTDGFTILTDLQNMVTHPQEMKTIHEEAHLMVMEAGVSQVAHVVSEDKIANLQTNAIIQNSGLPVTNFTSIADADAWLDSHK